MVISPHSGQSNLTALSPGSIGRLQDEQVGSCAWSDIRISNFPDYISIYHSRIATVEKA